MPDAVLVAGLVGVAVGVAITLGLTLAVRLTRGTRELASDAEQARYEALHHASLAAAGMRAGLGGPDVSRAARHLRELLGGAGVALVEGDRVVACESGFEPTVGEAARQIARRVTETGRRHVFPRSAQPPAPEAVGAPIVVEGEVAGVVVAFATTVRAPLVRATGEVAQWCAAQLALGALDASRAALAESNLRALRAQISPHFVYNALTAVASYISTDPPRARDLVLEFADFTRYSFRRQGEFSTLAEELRCINSYLEIERARFGDRLTVRLRIAPETLATVIPFLSVQPLVENAVRHGIEPGEDGGLITISAHDDGTHTEITVEDDGAGMDPERARRLLSSEGEGLPAAHVGLRNVESRLRQLYGAGGGLVLETNQRAGTLVRMRVPKSQPQHEVVA